MIRLLIALLLSLLPASRATGQTQGQAEPASVPTPEKSAIWWEERVGHVLIDLPTKADGSDTSFAYAYYFAAIGPKPKKTTTTFGNCIRDAVRDAGATFRDEIERRTRITDAPLYAEAQVGHTRAALVSARAEYEARSISRCASSPAELRAYIDATRLALVRRECVGKRCPSLQRPSVATLSAVSEGEKRARAFEAIYYWALRDGVDRGLDQVVHLAPGGQQNLSPTLEEVIEVAASGWETGKISQTDARRRLELRISQIHADRTIPLLSPVVTAQLELPRSITLRTSYAFSDPQSAYDLATDSTNTKLSLIQDEVARTRIYECRVLRGLLSSSAVAACSGYTISEPQLLACLSGGACMPDIADQVRASVMLQASTGRIEDLVRSTIVPRLESSSFGELVTAYNECAARQSESDVPGCVGRSQIPAEMKVQVDCLLDGPESDRLGCVVPADAPAAAKLLQACAQRGGRACGLEAAVPPELSCLLQASTIEEVSCIDMGGDVGRIRGCLSSPGRDFERAICIAGDNIPAGLRPLADCYSQGGTEAAMAVCALAGTLPPEQTMLLRCATQSNGNYVGAGVCVATSFLNLNAGQQILLQCAASSGGVPATFAVCAIGQFAFQELTKCKGKGFGEGDCFGRGNEFQRLAFVLTGDYISSASVIGQYLTVQIKVANAAVAGLGNIFSEAGRGIDNTADGFNHEYEKLKSDPVRLVLDAPGNIVRESCKGVDGILGFFGADDAVDCT
jgi:hypothetical protein